MPISYVRAPVSIPGSAALSSFLLTCMLGGGRCYFRELGPHSQLERPGWTCWFLAWAYLSQFQLLQEKSTSEWEISLSFSISASLCLLKKMKISTKKIIIKWKAILYLHQTLIPKNLSFRKNALQKKAQQCVHPTFSMLIQFIFYFILNIIYIVERDTHHVGLWLGSGG